MQPIDFSLALCGFGPANSGLLFSLAKSGNLAAVAPRGVLIIERGRSLGSGSLSRYKIPSNTLADVILECVCDERLPAAMTRLRQRSSTIARLERMRGEAPDLDLVSECLSDAAELLVSDLSQRHRIALRREHRIEAVTVRDDGMFDLVLRSRSGEQVSARVATLVLNLGGTQADESGASLRDLLHGVPPGNVPVLHSDPILQYSEADLLARLSPHIGARRTLVVAGSSHSAFSVIERLAPVSERLGLARIVLAHRSPPRFYYRDVAQAQAFGEHVDVQQDVCPLSGRVNRLGGLRFRTADVARQVFETQRLDRHRIAIEPRHVAIGRSPPGATGDLSDVAAIITCFGYRPRLPLLWDSAGAPLRLAEDEHGLTTDDVGRPMRDDGRVIHGLFAFGLGSGMSIGTEVGGEPSYRRRLDGIWLYHNHVGAKVTTGMLRDIHRDDRGISANITVASRLETR